jgi:uncharacterized membrane protein HdeD (DUF308 family)
MWLPHNDPFEPTEAERSKALGWIAMILSALFSAVTLAVLFNLDSPQVWIWVFAIAISLVVCGPKEIASFRKFFRWLRRM